LDGWLRESDGKEKFLSFAGDFRELLVSFVENYDGIISELSIITSFMLLL
jgi:hypothetical protein